MKKASFDNEKFLENIEITLEEIFGDPVESNDKLRMTDKWVEKQLLSNPNIKPCNKRPYPYKRHIVIQDLLKKYGKDFINELIPLVPPNIKKFIDGELNVLIDSVAWTIWDRKLDPRSIRPNIPEYGSFWDKISDTEHV